MKRHATTIVLLVVAAVLGAWLWIGRDTITAGERARREGSVFAAWRREELSRIEIARPDETLVLTRDAAKDAPWRMQKPRDDKADQAAVERLLTTLEFAVIVRKANEKAEEPRAKVTITMGRLTLHLSLFGPSPRPEGSAYARVDDGPIVVVSKELADALLARSDTYRDRQIVPYLSTELARFEAKTPASAFTLERIDDRAFRVKEEGALFGRGAADRIWGALADVRAESFPSDADADRLTASPRLTLILTPKDRPPAELVFGEPCPGAPESVTVVRKTPTRSTACAPRAVLDAFTASPASLVEKHVFTLRHDEMEEVRLELLADEASTIELARKGSGFHMRAPKDRDLDADEADAASELLSRLEFSVAESVTRGDGAFTPVARAKVRHGEREETVEVGAMVADARVVVRRLLDGARLEVTPAVARRLVPRRTTLKPRTLLGDSRRVVRVNLACGTPQQFVDRGEGLRLVDPKGYETDAGITSLVDTLLKSKVDAWVADAPDASFGIEKGDCKVTLVFEDGKDPHTVLFGADGETGMYGRIEGQPDVFVAPRSWRDLARGIYVSRAPLRLSGDVTVTYVGHPPFHAEMDFIPDRAVRLGKPDVKPALVLESGDIKITCGAPSESGARTCARDGVLATFEAAGARFEKIARDGGAR